MFCVWMMFGKKISMNIEWIFVPSTQLSSRSSNFLPPLLYSKCPFLCWFQETFSLLKPQHTILECHNQTWCQRFHQWRTTHATLQAYLICNTWWIAEYWVEKYIELVLLNGKDFPMHNTRYKPQVCKPFKKTMEPTIRKKGGLFFQWVPPFF